MHLFIVVKNVIVAAAAAVAVRSQPGMCNRTVRRVVHGYHCGE